MRLVRCRESEFCVWRDFALGGVRAARDFVAWSLDRWSWSVVFAGRMQASTQQYPHDKIDAIALGASDSSSQVSTEHGAQCTAAVRSSRG